MIRMKINKHKNILCFNLYAQKHTDSLFKACHSNIIKLSYIYKYINDIVCILNDILLITKPPEPIGISIEISMVITKVI